MPAVAGGRACAACEHVVHDLSAMSEREAARFVTERRGQRVCMRYLARADGTIVYRPEPPRAGPAVMAAALAACAPWEPPPEIRDEVEVVEAPVAPPVTVVVPAVAAAPVVEPPDDDINPCPPPLVESGKGKKKSTPKPGKAAARKPVEYVGFEG
mgnify:CR=1 FL=1